MPKLRGKKWRDAHSAITCFNKRRGALSEGQQWEKIQKCRMFQRWSAGKFLKDFEEKVEVYFIFTLYIVFYLSFAQYGVYLWTK